MEDENVEESKSVQEDKNPEEKKDSKNAKQKKKIIILASGLLLVVVIAFILIRLLIPKMANVEWISNKMVGLYIAVGLGVAAVVAWLLLRKTLRTRLRMQKVIRQDPDINDWLIIFNWTPKILYVPTIIASFIAAALSCISCIPGAAIGGIWLAIFFLNYLVEEYSISIKILIITLVSLGFFLLWLHLLGWVVDFLRLFRHIAVSMNPTMYLIVGIIGLLSIFVSWLKGLFYYVTMTPNYMNLQEGPTESGEQIGREDYNTRVDTSDFLERLMGFGRIIITFKERKRQPITVLVWRIQKKAQLLERVRAKLAIDHLQPAQPQLQ
ncbi:MAG: hypothetical protein ACYTFW_03820 [Planctomycetota bacterium]|jgi:hypothetical protein